MVVVKSHQERSLALRNASEEGRVAEHFIQRDMTLQDGMRVDVGAMVMDMIDFSSPGSGDVIKHLFGIVGRSLDLDLHDGFE